MLSECLSPCFRCDEVVLTEMHQAVRAGGDSADRTERGRGLDFTLEGSRLGKRVFLDQEANSNRKPGL